MLKQLMYVSVVSALFYQSVKGDVSSTVQPYPHCPSVDPNTPVYFEDPNDCSAFYECSNGEAVHFLCPVGTYYSNNDCRWSKDVNCGTRPTTPDPQTTPVSNLNRN